MTQSQSQSQRPQHRRRAEPDKILSPREVGRLLAHEWLDSRRKDGSVYATASGDEIHITEKHLAAFATIAYETGYEDCEERVRQAAAAALARQREDRHE